MTKQQIETLKLAKHARAEILKNLNILPSEFDHRTKYRLSLQFGEPHTLADMDNNYLNLPGDRRAIGGQDQEDDFYQYRPQIETIMADWSRLVRRFAVGNLDDGALVDELSSAKDKIEKILDAIRGGAAATFQTRRVALNSGNIRSDLHLHAGRSVLRFA